MTAPCFLSLRGPRRGGSVRYSYLACECGHPVWRSDPGVLLTAGTAMGRAIVSWRRRQRVKAAKGKHSSEEIQEILEIQRGRCFYCNSKFTDGLRCERDHLLSIAGGGANWALNIVLACKSCNSRRCDIPFRTYCKLLSPTQNRRMLVCLRKRLMALDPSNLPYEALAAFNSALAEHDPRHWRYLDIQHRHSKRREYATRNRLFPGSVSLILKGARAD
ncbi:MAG: HNH endonuclease [Candidatus Sulfotelmatobacter sp.]